MSPGAGVFLCWLSKWVIFQLGCGEQLNGPGLSRFLGCRSPSQAKSLLPFPPRASHLDGEAFFAQLIQELIPLDLLLTAHFVDVTHQDKIPLLFILPTKPAGNY